MPVSRRTFMRLAAAGLGSALITGCAIPPDNRGAGHAPTPGSPLTPPESWYVISFQGVQEVDIEHYRMELYGLVDRPRRWSIEALKSRFEPVLQYDTLACVGNEPGGPLRSSGMFRGIRVRDLLEDAGLSARGMSAMFTGLDGFVAMRRVEDLLKDTSLLVFEVGTSEDTLVPLPVGNGFPMRLITPGYYGFMQAKWIDSMEIVDDGHIFDVLSRSTDYFNGQMQLASGFTQPNQGWKLNAATPFLMLGWAYGDGRPIDRVDVRVDEGPWLPAEIAWNTPDDEFPPYVWTLWQFAWLEPPPGTHHLTTRATYADGETQFEDREFPYSGGTAQRIRITVEEPVEG